MIRDSLIKEYALYTLYIGIVKRNCQLKIIDNIICENFNKKKLINKLFILFITFAVSRRFVRVGRLNHFPHVG